MATVIAEQASKKDRIMTAFKQLLERVESHRLYGEFSISFAAQDGVIGHFTETTKRTSK